MKATGIRTKEHTLEFCRQIPRATDLNTRLTLASLFKAADKPCKRLFLDYKGLQFVYGWMKGLGFGEEELNLKLAIEENILAELNVPNRTLLEESRVLQLLNWWSTASSQEEIDALASRAPSPAPKETKRKSTEKKESSLSSNTPR